MNFAEIQEALCATDLDGWLFFDHHRRDPLAYRILSIPAEVSVTRRWYYLIPSKGDPRKLVHHIESRSLDALPGVKDTYASWVDQQNKVALLLEGVRTIAMQYSPKCAIPYVSLVDAGTIELIAATGVKISSSADLIQRFDSLWSDAQYEMHIEAGRLVDQTRREAFKLVGEALRAGQLINEFQVQQFMCQRFSELGLFAEHGPIVAINSNASDPHYEPSESFNSPIQRGDLLLIDCWAKLKKQAAVYYDITWTGFTGDIVPDEINNVFAIVRDARKAATNFVTNRVATGTSVAGYEVDDAARSHIKDKGFGEYFTHRTGHSIGEEVHGTGANMENLESDDDRKITTGSCFSIEPGIYLPNFGIRSEVNIFVHSDSACVTGEEQERLLII